MKLQRPHRRAMPETIIALVDVVFFLLVFFLLIGRMDATAPFDVLPPQAGSGTTMPGGGVTISVAADGALAFEGRALMRAALLEQLDAVARQAPGRLVRINAHRDADLQRILPLVAEITRLGLQDVVLVVTPQAP